MIRRRQVLLSSKGRSVMDGYGCFNLSKIQRMVPMEMKNMFAKHFPTCCALIHPSQIMAVDFYNNMSDGIIHYISDGI